MTDAEPVVVECADANAKNNLTKLEQDIIRQIEYYFSENNLRRDKFMIEKTSADEGWIEIAVLLTFKRLKQITEDAQAIADAIVKSNSGTVQLSEDKLKLRRHPDNPLPEFNETRRKELQARTAYAKGFPLDSKISDIIEYFHSNFENVEQVTMRKWFDPKSKDHKFKGSVFVAFTTKEQAEAFVEKKDVTYLEKDLLRYTMTMYIEIKKTERAEQERKKKDVVKAKEIAAETPLPKGAVVHFVGAEGIEITREDIKDRISELEPSVNVAFIHYQKGDKEGDLRFNKENDGKTLLEKLEKGKVSWHWLVVRFLLNFNFRR